MEFRADQLGLTKQAEKFARKCFEPLELYSFKDNFKSLADHEPNTGIRYLKEDTIARFLELPDILAVSPVIFHMLSYIGAFPFLRDAPAVLGFEQMIMIVTIMTGRHEKVLTKSASNRRKLLFKSLAVYDRKLSEIEKQQREGDAKDSTKDDANTARGAASHAPGFAVDAAGDDLEDDVDDDDELVLGALDALDINDAFKKGDSHAASTHGAMIPADNFRKLIMLLLLVAPLGPQESLSSYASRLKGDELENLRATAEDVLSAFLNVEKSPGITFAQFLNVVPVNFPYLFDGFNPLFEHFLFSKNLDFTKHRDDAPRSPAPVVVVPPLPPVLKDVGQIMNLSVLSQLSFFIPGSDLFHRLRLLYSGGDAGFSMGSFETKVFNWRAPTILLVSGTRLGSGSASAAGSEGVFNDSLPPRRFPHGGGGGHHSDDDDDEQRLVFGAYVSQPWRYTFKECFGTPDTILFQLSPTHDVFSGSAVNGERVAFTKAPTPTPGISFGCPHPQTSQAVGAGGGGGAGRHHHRHGSGAGTSVTPSVPMRHLGPVSLAIDSSFEFGVFTHDWTSRGGAFATSTARRFDFQERFRVDDLEVWGCGGDEEARVQRERWEWEAREAEARRKINLGTGDPATDRALLEMAGLIGGHRSGGSMG